MEGFPSTALARERFRVRNAASSPLGRISQAGYLEKTAWFRIKPMRVLGSYAAVYVYDGEGAYEDAHGLQQPVATGDLIVVYPELAHTYGPNDRGWREIYLVFDGPVFDLWRQAGLLDDRQPVHHLEPVDHWLRRFGSVLGAPAEAGWSPPLLEVCRLQEVLAEALVGGPRGTLRQDEVQWASRACALLEADPQRPLSLEQVADELGTSYASFRRRFTQVVGMPPGRYRAVRAIDRACELMQQTDLSDNQIAGALGFCDELHFSRRFKQITGRSPREYRRELPHGMVANRG